MQLIVGLGNPGPEYERTRHNVGFVAVESLAVAWGLEWRKCYDARYAHGALDGHEVYLLEPLTFMNRSGEAVGPFARQHAITPKNILVVSDEAQLPVGMPRLSGGGSSGGHHGLESLIAALGTQEFARLRIGIGQPPLPKDLTGLVLGRWSEGEWSRITAVLPAVAEACAHLVKGEVVAADNALTGFINRARERE